MTMFCIENLFLYMYIYAFVLIQYTSSLGLHPASDLAVSILAGEWYIALLGKVRQAIFSLPKIVNKSRLIHEECTIGL